MNQQADTIKTKGRFVMVPMDKLNTRCESTGHPNFRCQRIEGHRGAHMFWREIPLSAWSNRTASTAVISNPTNAEEE